MSKTAKWVIAGLVGFVVVLCILVAYLSSIAPKNSPTTPSQKPTAEVKEPEKPDLEVLSSEWVNDGYVSYISGLVRNNTDHQYGYVQISIPLYDKSGNLVGSAFDNVNSLSPGGTWKYKALVMEEGKVSYRKSEIEIEGF